jgi:hypothetical protein
MIRKIILCYLLFQISNFHSYKIERYKKCIKYAVNNSNIIDSNLNKYYKYEIYNCIYNENDIPYQYCKNLNNYLNNYLNNKNNCFNLLKIEIIIIYLFIFLPILLNFL